jgi:hypothetical protein
MAGIVNRTARQFNLKTIAKNGTYVSLRLAPGFNVVEDATWALFAADQYVVDLSKKGCIDFGDHTDDMELERDADTKAKVKKRPVAKK